MLLKEADPRLSPMPETVWPLEPTPAEAVVVHCADPRFQNAFRQFITQSLGIRNYVPIVAGGGAHALAMRDINPRAADALWQQIEFMVTQFRVKELVIFGHADCRWYQLHDDPHRTTEEVRTRADLPAVGEYLSRMLSGVRVRCYWAGIDGDNVKFSEVV